MYYQVCQHFEFTSSGRGQKKVSKLGRPTGETAKAVIDHMEKLVPSSFFPVEDLLQQSSVSDVSPNLCCPICTVLLDRPVELGCGSIVCLSCCKKWIQHHLCSSLLCPCCYNSTFDSGHIRPPPALVVGLLKELLLPCNKGCGKLVRLESYIKHAQGKCQSHYVVVDSPSKTTMSDVLSRPSNLPATPAERRVAEHLVRKIITRNESERQGVLRVPTSGQVCVNYCNCMVIHICYYKIANYLHASN